MWKNRGVRNFVEAVLACSHVGLGSARSRQGRKRG
jgi:hypothetical protein